MNPTFLVAGILLAALGAALVVAPLEMLLTFDRLPFRPSIYRLALAATQDEADARRTVSVFFRVFGAGFLFGGGIIVLLAFFTSR